MATLTLSYDEEDIRAQQLINFLKTLDYMKL